MSKKFSELGEERKIIELSTVKTETLTLQYVA